jgi:hypothetical protein
VSDQDLSLTVIDQPDGLFDITLPAMIKAGESAEGVLKLRDDALDTEFQKSVTIQLNDEQTTRFTIPVKRSLRAPGPQASTTK